MSSHCHHPEKHKKMRITTKKMFIINIFPCSNKKNRCCLIIRLLVRRRVFAPPEGGLEREREECSAQCAACKSRTAKKTLSIIIMMHLTEYPFHILSVCRTFFTSLKDIFSCFSVCFNSVTPRKKRKEMIKNVF